MSCTTRNTNYAYYFRSSGKAAFAAVQANRDIEAEYDCKLGARRTTTRRLIHPWEDVYKSWLSDKHQSHKFLQISA